jgi:hypothetical protein
MDKRDSIKLIFLFILTYIILYFLPAIVKPIEPFFDFISFNLMNFFPTHEWGFTLNPSMLDYTFFLMPFVGFFFIYFLIDWINDYFESSFAHSVYFPLLFVVLSFIAFYIQLYWYYSNLASLAAAQGQTIAVNEFFEYWGVLRDSAFLVFIFSGLAGWISYKIMQKVSESALEQQKRNPVKPKKSEPKPEKKTESKNKEETFEVKLEQT